MSPEQQRCPVTPQGRCVPVPESVPVPKGCCALDPKGCCAPVPGDAVPPVPVGCCTPIPKGHRALVPKGRRALAAAARRGQGAGRAVGAAGSGARCPGAFCASSWSGVSVWDGSAAPRASLSRACEPLRAAWASFRAFSSSLCSARATSRGQQQHLTPGTRCKEQPGFPQADGCCPGEGPDGGTRCQASPERGLAPPLGSPPCAEPGSGQGVQFLRDGDFREMLGLRPSPCWMREVPPWGNAGSCVMGTGHGQQCP